MKVRESIPGIRKTNVWRERKNSKISEVVEELKVRGGSHKGEGVAGWQEEVRGGAHWV